MTLPFSRRSVRFLSVCGYVVRVILLLDVDDAEGLSLRSGVVCDEILPLVADFASTQFRNGTFSRDLDGSGPGDTLTDNENLVAPRTEATNTLTIKMTLRRLLVGITLLNLRSPIRGSGIGGGGELVPEAAAQFEIIVYVADRAAATARTAAALSAPPPRARA